MKYSFSVILSVFLANFTFAQQYEVRRDTTITESSDKYKVETNRFFGNWFLGAGAGGNIFIGDHDRQMDISDRIAPVYSVYLGKWFTPGIGVRTNFTVGQVKGVTGLSDVDGTHGWYMLPTLYKGDGLGKNLYDEKFKYRHYHADALFNLTNLFKGYKEDRFYNLNFYAGLGWMVNYSPITNPNKLNASHKKTRDVSANIGMEHVFRITKSLGLALDVRGAMVDDRFDGDLGLRRQEGPVSATLGLKYNFNKRSWNKPVTTVIEHNAEDLKALRDAVNKMAADNESLKRQLADAKSRVITDIKVEKTLLAAPILVTFPIDTWIVKNEIRVNLGFFAKIIKEADPNIKYRITGYADKGTGSPKRNERLSKERANVIYEILVKEFDVNPNQLITEHRGGVENMFYDDPRVSRAVIVIAE